MLGRLIALALIALALAAPAHALTPWQRVLLSAAPVTILPQVAGSATLELDATQDTCLAQTYATDMTAASQTVCGGVVTLVGSGWDANGQLTYTPCSANCNRGSSIFTLTSSRLAAIPTTASIDSIDWAFRGCTSSGNAYQWLVQPVIGGVIQGANSANDSTGTGSATCANFTGSWTGGVGGDLDGAVITPAMLNAGGFGLAVRMVRTASGAANIGLGNLTLTVHYHTNTWLTSPATAGGFTTVPMAAAATFTTWNFSAPGTPAGAWLLEPYIRNTDFGAAAGADATDWTIAIANGTHPSQVFDYYGATDCSGGSGAGVKGHQVGLMGQSLANAQTINQANVISRGETNAALGGQSGNWTATYGAAGNKIRDPVCGATGIAATIATDGGNDGQLVGYVAIMGTTLGFERLNGGTDDSSSPSVTMTTTGWPDLILTASNGDSAGGQCDGLGTSCTVGGTVAGHHTWLDHEWSAVCLDAAHAVTSVFVNESQQTQYGSTPTLLTSARGHGVIDTDANGATPFSPARPMLAYTADWKGTATASDGVHNSFGYQLGTITSSTVPIYQRVVGVNGVTSSGNNSGADVTAYALPAGEHCVAVTIKLPTATGSFDVKAAAALNHAIPGTVDSVFGVLTMLTASEVDNQGGFADSASDDNAIGLSWVYADRFNTFSAGHNFLTGVSTVQASRWFARRSWLFYTSNSAGVPATVGFQASVTSFGVGTFVLNVTALDANFTGTQRFGVLAVFYH